MKKRHLGLVAGVAPVLLVLAACLSWAAYTVLVKQYTERVDGIVLSALTMVGGAIPLALLASPSLAGVAWGPVGPAAWGAIAFSGLGALVIAYLFWYRGVRTLGPTRTAMYSISAVTIPRRA